MFTSFFPPYSHLTSQKHGCLEGRCVILGSVCPSASVRMDGDFSGLTKVQALLIFRSQDQIEGSSYRVLANVSTTHHTHHLHLFSLLRGTDRLSPPLDIQLETINCSAFSVRWKMPRRHVSTITGYKVVISCIKAGDR